MNEVKFNCFFIVCRLYQLPEFWSPNTSSPSTFNVSRNKFPAHCQFQTYWGEIGLRPLYIRPASPEKKVTRKKEKKQLTSQRHAGGTKAVSCPERNDFRFTRWPNFFISMFLFWFWNSTYFQFSKSDRCSLFCNLATPGRRSPWKPQYLGESKVMI